MPNVFRFRRLSEAPEPNRNSEAIYANAAGELKQVAPDGSETDLGGGGGGSQPITREQFSTDGMAFTAGQSKYATWTKHAGDTLFDLTDPLHPVVVDPGVYAVTVSIGNYGDVVTGGYLYLALGMDDDGEASTATAVAPYPPSAAGPDPWVSVSLTYYLPAAAAISAYIVNNTDAALANVFLVASAQRIS